LSIRFQADNDLKFAIVKAVRRREPAIDFASAQESGLDGLDDSELLERDAREGRVLVSHDLRTMLNHFRSHLTAGKSSPGLLVVSQGAPIGDVVEALVVLWSAPDPVSDRAEWRNQVHHLPSLSRHVFPSWL
jgi:hypothetical protein